MGTLGPKYLICGYLDPLGMLYSCHLCPCSDGWEDAVTDLVERTHPMGPNTYMVHTYAAQ